jgi:hypothetical protein
LRGLDRVLNSRTYSKSVPKENPPDTFFRDCAAEKWQHAVVKYLFDGEQFAHWFATYSSSRQADKLKVIYSLGFSIHCVVSSV